MQLILFLLTYYVNWASHQYIAKLINRGVSPGQPHWKTVSLDKGKVGFKFERMVKKFGDEHVRGNGLPALHWVHRRVIKPSEEELTANPRARSAQLRVLEKE